MRISPDACGRTWGLFIFVAAGITLAAGQTVTVAPASLSFGNQVLETSSPLQPVTLKNGLTVALKISNISTTLSDYGQTSTCPLSPSTLAAGKTCTISVSFTPSALGVRSGSLKITDSASNSPQTVALSGTGIAAAATSPTSLSFASQALGTSSTTQTVTLTNNQSSSLTIGPVTSSLADFIVTSSCPPTLAGGASCAASVTFSPKATGARSGTLSFNDSAANSPQKVALTGTGAAANLVSIAVSPSPASIALGNTQQFVATGTYTNGTTKTLTSSVTWMSSSTSVASVSAGGLATSVAQGETTITATSGAISGSSALSVTAPVLTSIAVTPLTATIALGTTQQFAAIGTYSNKSTQTLTSSATWSSSSTTVASVGSAGLASSLAQGKTTIAATSGTIKGTAALTVGAPTLVSIAVTPVTASIALGTTQQFAAIGTYSNKSTQTLTSSVSWSSSSTTVASISSAGLASSLAQGSTTITATSGTIKGTAALTVGAPTLVSIAVTPVTASIALGTTQQFAAIGTYSNKSTQTLTSSVTWSSSSTTVASVSSAGLASSLAQGKTTIAATSGTIKGTAALTVGAPTLVSIAVTPATASIALGTTQQFAASGTYTNGSTQNLTSSVTWSSSAAGVASISSTGLASSAAQGGTTITATLGTISGSSSLTVTPAVLLSIAVSPANANIPLDTTQPFTATGTYSDGSTQNLTSSASWTSSAAAVASVSSSGLATGVGQGTATILAASGTISGSASITVGQPALVSMAITPTNGSFALGTNLPFKAIGTYTDGSTLDITTSVAWSTGNSSIATVNAQGIATSVAVGSTSVTGALGTVTGATTLTVNPATLVSIAVTPAIPSIPLGTTVQFAATGTFTDGSTQNVTDTVQWSSDTTSVATVSNSTGSRGLASSVATGSANISATSGSVQGSTTLTVSSAALVSISVTPGNPSVALGTTQQFVATGTFTDGSTQNLTSTVTWSSDTLSSATINGGGVAQSVAVGTATISATSNNISGSTLLTVTPAQLASIAVNPPTANTPLGTTQAFTATGTYTDGTTQDVTQSGHWSSSNASAATISNTPGSQGVASTVGVGTTAIGIALGTVNGSATLAVNPAALVTITLSPQTPNIPLGTTQQFTASGTYTDGSTQDLTTTAQWASSSAMIAVLNATGLATSSGTGTATITATLGTVSASTTLTVGRPAIVSLVVSPSAAAIPLGTTQQFTATATYTDGSTQDLTASATWSSDTQSVALVGSTGLASGIGMGGANIVATSGGISGPGALTVGPPVLVSLAVTPSATSIPLGTTQQFSAIGTYTNGTVQNLTGSVNWTSSSNVASVSTTGLASSTAVGTTTITASAGSISASASLTVGAPALVSLAITPSALSIPLGTTERFSAAGTYTDGSTQNLTGSVTWSSSSNAASVSGTGLASANAIGTAVITASAGSISSAATLTVGPPALASLAIAPTAATVPLGTMQQFSATGTYTDGSTQDLTGTVSWGSSSNAASISTTGLATAAAVGTAMITASDGSISATANLTVGSAALVSLAITPSNGSFALGTTLPMKAIGTYTDGSTLDVTNTATWSTANSAIATIGQGIASGVAVGSTSVTATVGSVSGTTTLTVSPAALVTIAITPTIPTIPLGTTVQFTATGTFTDGSTQNVTDTVQWSSDTTSVATVSNSTGSRGLASSVATGSANISATSGSVQGSTTLTVSSAALVSISVTPGNPSVALGTTQQFVATGTFTDGSTQNLTSTVTWSSDTLSSATINGGGVAQSVAVGTATISATSNNISGSTLLTVTPAQPVSIAVNPSTANTPLGATEGFTALATYTDGTTQDVTQSGHWSSSNATAATVSNTPGSQGLATTLGTGTTTIAIALGSVSGTATLTVNPAALVTITISPQTPSIPLGTTQQFTASGTYTDGTTQDLTGTVQWNSSSAMIAVISATGLTTSAGSGTATISAALGSVSASTTLTVGQPAIVSLAVSPSVSTIALGTTQQFTATATYTDGSTQDLTATATWSSSVPGIAAVNATGLATSVSIGTTTISAASGAATGGSVLTVAPAVPVSLAVTPTSASIAFDAQQQFEAFLTYSDGSIVNVTNLVTWTSSASSVATVSTAGLATGVGAGSATIYASANAGMVVDSALTVAPPSLVSIAITPATSTLVLSSSQQFTATGTFADNSKQDLTESVAWSSSNSVAVGIGSSGLGTALGFGVSTVTATSGSIRGSSVVTVPTAAIIPPSLFDMTINKNTTPWPTDTFYGQRLLGTGTLWGNVETANGVYSWTVLNKFVANAQAHGTDLIYTFLGVPPWASSNPSDTLCTSWAGSCDPPNDLNSDGTGSNAQWDTFVTAIATEVGTKVKYWELWDEPNVAGFANPKTWTAAQWVRMAKDARQIILSINPNAVIVSPGTAVGTSWLTSFLAAGGGSYVDVIAFHGYANPPESVVPLIVPVQAAMQAGGVGSLPLWDTEASWGLNTALPDPNMQAGSVARLYLLNAAHGVARFYWYGWDFSNRGTMWQPTSSTGCTTANNGGYICLSGIAYAQVYNWMDGAVLSGCSSAGTIWTCTLARPGGYFAQVMWDSSQTCSDGVCQATSYTPPAQFIQYRDLNGNTYTLNGSTTVPLGAEPIILENQVTEK